MTRKKQAYLRAKNSLIEFTQAAEELIQLTPKELQWVMPRLQKIFDRHEDRMQRISNALSNADKKSKGVKPSNTVPEIDDLPF